MSEIKIINYCWQCVDANIIVDIGLGVDVGVEVYADKNSDVHEWFHG